MSVTKQFKDIDVGSEFTLNGLRYIKIDTVKISCCRSINAKSLDNASIQTKIEPLTEVEVDG